MKSNRGSAGSAESRFALDERDAIGHTMALGVSAGDGQRGGADVDGRDVGVGHVLGRADGEDAAAGADVGDGDGGWGLGAGGWGRYWSLLDAIKQGDDEQLRFRPRNEHVRR